MVIELEKEIGSVVNGRRFAMPNGCMSSSLRHTSLCIGVGQQSCTTQNNILYMRKLCIVDFNECYNIRIYYMI
jgi:hypothetical protein